jgi:hypothetical protein
MLPGQHKPESKNKQKLVWHGEFNGQRLGTSTWNVLLREHSKLNELQYPLRHPSLVHFLPGRKKSQPQENGLPINKSQLKINAAKHTFYFVLCY